MNVVLFYSFVDNAIYDKWQPNSGGWYSTIISSGENTYLCIFLLHQY